MWLVCNDLEFVFEQDIRLRANRHTRARVEGRPLILGIGTDLANIERIQATLDRFGDRFRNRVFTEREQARAERMPQPAPAYAKRWAAKEACSKALGTGLRMGISWKDMSVRNLPTGQPVMEVTGWAKERLETMTPEGYIATIHVTLTDDLPWAQAMVMIEALPFDEEKARPILRVSG